MVVIAPDGGEKYLSTTLCNQTLCGMRTKIRHPMLLIDGTPI